MQMNNFGKSAFPHLNKYLENQRFIEGSHLSYRWNRVQLESVELVISCLRNSKIEALPTMDDVKQCKSNWSIHNPPLYETTQEGPLLN